MRRPRRVTPYVSTKYEIVEEAHKTTSRETAAPQEDGTVPTLPPSSRAVNTNGKTRIGVVFSSKLIAAPPGADVSPCVPPSDKTNKHFSDSLPFSPSATNEGSITPTRTHEGLIAAANRAGISRGTLESHLNKLLGKSGREQLLNAVCLGYRSRKCAEYNSLRGLGFPREEHMAFLPVVDLWVLAESLNLTDPFVKTFNVSFDSCVKKRAVDSSLVRKVKPDTEFCSHPPWRPPTVRALNFKKWDSPGVPASGKPDSVSVLDNSHIRAPEHQPSGGQQSPYSLYQEIQYQQEQPLRPQLEKQPAVSRSCKRQYSSGSHHQLGSLGIQPPVSETAQGCEKVEVGQSERQQRQSQRLPEKSLIQQQPLYLPTPVEVRGNLPKRQGHMPFRRDLHNRQLHQQQPVPPQLHPPVKHPHLHPVVDESFFQGETQVELSKINLPDRSASERNQDYHLLECQRRSREQPPQSRDVLEVNQRLLSESFFHDALVQPEPQPALRHLEHCTINSQPTLLDHLHHTSYKHERHNQSCQVELTLELRAFHLEGRKVEELPDSLGRKLQFRFGSAYLSCLVAGFHTPPAQQSAATDLSEGCEQGAHACVGEQFCAWNQCTQDANQWPDACPSSKELQRLKLSLEVCKEVPFLYHSALNTTAVSESPEHSSSVSGRPPPPLGGADTQHNWRRPSSRLSHPASVHATPTSTGSHRMDGENSNRSASASPSLPSLNRHHRTSPWVSDQFSEDSSVEDNDPGMWLSSTTRPDGLEPRLFGTDFAWHHVR